MGTIACGKSTAICVMDTSYYGAASIALSISILSMGFSSESVWIYGRKVIREEGSQGSGRGSKQYLRLGPHRHMVTKATSGANLNPGTVVIELSDVHEVVGTPL
jgi:hypothetical protein